MDSISSLKEALVSTRVINDPKIYSTCILKQKHLKLCRAHFDVLSWLSLNLKIRLLVCPCSACRALFKSYSQMRNKVKSKYQDG